MLGKVEQGSYFKKPFLKFCETSVKKKAIVHAMAVHMLVQS